MTYSIPTQARIGHVHLKVSDLEQSLDFYCGLLGFELIMRYGKDAAFISAGGYHHHIGLNTWQSKGSPPAHVQSRATAGEEATGTDENSAKYRAATLRPPANGVALPA